MKRSAGLFSLLLGVVLALVPLSAGAAPGCGITWGSLDKQAEHPDGQELQDVRTGRHECYDRLVLDVGGGPASYVVRYVPQVYEDASGEPVALRGAAFLEVVVRVPAYDQNGRPTYHPADENELVDVTGYRTFRQVAWAGSFEGQTTIGVGVRARLPFRVFVLDGPGGDGRVVLDVAHAW
ncbi:MAG: hypothetical protein ACLGIA_13035 [Actinomycetes bacterium]